MNAKAIGPYLIVRELGRGGMGVVYEVRHPEIDRPLALKLILAKGEIEAIARFGREAQLLAKVDHPGVLKVHALARTEDGHPYLVTDFVEGKSLKAVRVEAPMTWRRAAELVRDLAGIVAAVHAKGILHRDLKPDNVIVQPDGTPVVLDFGLARDGSLEKLTETGTVLGTLSYMAPEQAQGQSTSRLDERADVYALGAILFFLLAGRAPYDDRGSAQLIVQLLTKEPRWPSADDPTVPAALEAICRRAMTKDRMVRTRDAATLREELDRWLRGEVVDRSSRRPVMVVAVVVVLAVLAGVLAVPRREGRAPPPPSQPPAPAPIASPPVVKPREPTRLERYRELACKRRGADAAGRQAIDADLRKLRLQEPLVRLVSPAAPSGNLDQQGAVAFVDDTHVVSRHHTREGLFSWDLSEPAPAPARICAAAADDGAHALFFRALAVHAGHVYFAPDPGRIVRVAWRGGSAPETVLEAPDAKGELVAAAVSRDGERLVAGGTHRVAWVSDLKRPGHPPRSLVVNEHTVVALALSRDGNWVAVGTACPEKRDSLDTATTTRTLAVFSTRDGSLRDEAYAADMTIEAVTFSPSRDLVAAAGMGSGARVRVHALDGAALPELPEAVAGMRASDPQVKGLCFSPTGERLYSLGLNPVSDDVVLSFWDLAKGPSRTLTVKREKGSPWLGVDVSPDGLLLVVSTGRDDTFDVYAAWKDGESPP